MSQSILDMGMFYYNMKAASLVVYMREDNTTMCLNEE